MPAIYVLDAKLLFNTGLFSPGRKAQSHLGSSELLRAIEFYGIHEDHHGGGRGHKPALKLELVRIVMGKQE